MPRLKNTSPGLRGINAADGNLRWIQPGETVEIDASEAEVRNAMLRGSGVVIAGDEQKAEDEEGDLVARRQSGLEDTSMTAQALVPSTVHPMPPGQDITQPEQPVPTTIGSAPWAAASGPGSAAQTPNQMPGRQSAEETARQQAEAQGNAGRTPPPAGKAK